VASSSINGGILQCGGDSITLMLESIGGEYAFFLYLAIRKGSNINVPFLFGRQAKYGLHTTMDIPVNYTLDILTVLSLH
jgi:hypothetical protein